MITLNARQALWLLILFLSCLDANADNSFSLIHLLKKIAHLLTSLAAALTVICSPLSPSHPDAWNAVAEIVP